MAISRSKQRSEDGRRILRRRDSDTLQELFYERMLDDVDVLWCLQRAMNDRDSTAIMICGFLLGIPNAYERNQYLNEVLGYATV